MQPLFFEMTHDMNVHDEHDKVKTVTKNTKKQKNTTP